LFLVFLPQRVQRLARAQRQRAKVLPPRVERAELTSMDTSASV
jgi:hypothetical protein